MGSEGKTPSYLAGYQSGLREERERGAGEIERYSGLLEKVRRACLFSEDDGEIGVTSDPHISEELFDDICNALRPPKTTTV